MNGHAQPACNGWSPGSVIYAMFVDQDDRVAFYEMITAMTISASRTIQWATSLDIPAGDLEAGLSYGYGGNLYARTSNDGSVLGWNITFNAENTSISGSSLSEVAGEPSTPDWSHASWSIPPDASAVDEYEVLVLYQTDGGDVTVFSGVVNAYRGLRQSCLFRMTDGLDGTGPADSATVTPKKF